MSNIRWNFDLQGNDETIVRWMIDCDNFVGDWLLWHDGKMRFYCATNRDAFFSPELLQPNDQKIVQHPHRSEFLLNGRFASRKVLNVGPMSLWPRI